MTECNTSSAPQTSAETEPSNRLTPDDSAQKIFEWLEEGNDPANGSSRQNPFVMPQDLVDKLDQLDTAITDRINHNNSLLAVEPVGSENYNALNFENQLLGSTGVSIPTTTADDFMNSAGYPDHNFLQGLLTGSGGLLGLNALQNSLNNNTFFQTAQDFSQYSNFGTRDLISLINTHTGAHLGSMHTLLPMIAGGSVSRQLGSIPDPCGIVSDVLGSLLGLLGQLLKDLLDLLADLLRPIIELLALILGAILAIIGFIINELLKLLGILAGILNRALSELIRMLNPCFYVNGFVNEVIHPEIQEIMNSPSRPTRPWVNPDASGPTLPPPPPPITT